MKIEFHDAALRELEETTSYYRNQSKTLGRDFFKKAETAIRKAALHPRRGRHLDNPRLRAAEVRRFPYRVIYAIGDDSIFILSILSTKRREDYWKERIKDIE